MRVTIPTYITILRLFLIVPIIVLITTQHYIIALSLLIIALVSDSIDGYVARKYALITRLGQFLDHFADKVLVHVLLLYFVSTGQFWALWFGVFLVRDFLVLGIRHLATQRGVEIPSMSLGKVKFVGQSILLVLLVLVLEWPVYWLGLVTEVVTWASVLLAVLSAAQIVRRGIPALRS